MKINISVPNLRLFVGNIPKSKGKEEILDEFGKLTGNWKLNKNHQKKNKKTKMYNKKLCSNYIHNDIVLNQNQIKKMHVN